jgi:superfamily II DNA helicase RecQ
VSVLFSCQAFCSLTFVDYAWRDITRFDRMLLMDEKLSEDERRRQRDEARKVARYCMLDIDCRRQYVLQHFGENFDREACKKGCDNCISGKTGTIHDLTNEAKEIVGLVGQFQHDRFTRNACVQVYRGSASKDLQRWCASRYNGKGSHWDHNTVERIVSTMILEGILQEYGERTGGSRYFCDYIKVRFI